MNSVSTCETTSPPTTARPSGWRSSALAPAPSAIGSAPQDRRQRRHHDRPEAHQARLADRGVRRLAVALLRLSVERDVDHHDRVLLDDADQHQEADDGDHRQVDAEPASGEQCAERSRRQAGQDRQRVDEALIENAEHDVDRQHRAGDQQALPLPSALLEESWPTPAKLVPI
jgi:hypothetical protein